MSPKLQDILCTSIAERSHFASKVSFASPLRHLSMAGLVVIDSLGSFRVSTGMSTGSWIQSSLEQYGLHTEVCLENGLCFAPPEVRFSFVCTFEEVLLRHSHRKYAWCLLVSNGNDVYPQKMAPNIADSIMKSMNAALKLAPHVRVVFGASSSIWRYGGQRGSEYDRRIEDVMKAVECPIGASIITGAKELHPEASDIVDGICRFPFGIGATKVIEALKTLSYFEEPARAKL
jgi:hypothetical protein